MLLTACATPQAVHRPAQVDPDWWLGPLDDAQRHLLDAVEKSCPPQGLLSNEKCVKARIVEIFTRQNGASAHCDEGEPTGGVLLCADLFTSAERIYRTLGLDAQAVMDWDDPYDSFTALEGLRTARLAAKCPDVVKGECVAGELADMLAISTLDAGRCIVSGELKRHVHCAAALVRLDVYRTALHDAA